MIELHRGHHHRLGNDLPRARGIERFHFGEPFADGAVRRIQLHRIAQGVQRIGKMAGDRVAFGEVHFHLYDLALGHGLPHQVFAATGIPIHGVGVCVVGCPASRRSAQGFQAACLYASLHFLHVLFARRQGKFLFHSRSDILRRFGSLRLLRASTSAGAGGAEGIRAGLLSSRSEDGTDNVALRGRKTRRSKSRPCAAQLGGFSGGFRVGMGDWRREVISYKMLFYEEET